MLNVISKIISETANWNVPEAEKINLIREIINADQSAPLEQAASGKIRNERSELWKEYNRLDPAGAKELTYRNASVDKLRERISKLKSTPSEASTTRVAQKEAAPVDNGLPAPVEEDRGVELCGGQHGSSAFFAEVERVAEECTPTTKESSVDDIREEQSKSTSNPSEASTTPAAQEEAAAVENALPAPVEEIHII